MANDLQKLLYDMPDGWGTVYHAAIHPSSAYLPSCPRRFMYRNRLGWRKYRESEARDAGSIFHACRDACRPAGQLINKAITDIVTYFAEEAEDEASQRIDAGADPAATEKWLKKRRKTISMAATMVRVWYEHFPPKDTWENLASEVNIVREVEPGATKDWTTHMPVGFKINGTLDAVSYDHQKDEVWLEDDKTTGLSPAVFLKHLPFDTQTTLYRALWNKQAPQEQQAVGAIHNIIRRPTIRQKRGEKYEEYLERCFEWYADEAAKKPHQPPLTRSFVRFTGPPLERNKELHTILKMLSRMSSQALSLEAFPRAGNPSGGCALFGRNCPYMSLCLAAPRSWCDILRAENFTKEPQE